MLSSPLCKWCEKFLIAWFCGFSLYTNATLVQSWLFLYLYISVYWSFFACVWIHQYLSISLSAYFSLFNYISLSIYLCIYLLFYLPTKLLPRNIYWLITSMLIEITLRSPSTKKAFRIMWRRRLLSGTHVSAAMPPFFTGAHGRLWHHFITLSWQPSPLRGFA